MNTTSVNIPDWSREVCTRFWQPSRQLIKSLRRYQALEEKKGIHNKLTSKWWVFCHRFWSVVCGCDIPLNCHIGGGLLLPHPIGVVIHPNAVIGLNCLILQQVTIVADVEIGNQVDIGAGAKIIAAVEIGDYATIGANAVVTKPIPAYATAVGVPAKVISIRSAE